MKVPSKRYFENIFSSHSKTNKKVKVKQEAALLMFLRYLLFMKTLAKEADNMAFRQRRIMMKPTDVIEAEQIVGNISETARMMSRKTLAQSSRNLSGLQSGVMDLSDISDKENEHPDTSEAEESE